MPSLIVTSGALSGQVFSFSDSAVIGRGQLSEIRLNDPTVSRRHAMIRRNGYHFELRDQDSVNGTRHCGRRVDAVTLLGDGDELQFGEIKAVFRASRADQSSLPAASLTGDMATHTPTHSDAISAAPPAPLSGVHEMLSRLKMFCDLGLLAQRKQPLREKLECALDAIASTFPHTSRAAIYSHPIGNEHLALLAARNKSADASEFAQTQAFLQEALRLENGLNITAATERDALATRLRATSVPAAVLGLPLRLGDDVLGVLYLESRLVEHAWGVADNELFLGVAGQLAWMIASERAQSPERAIEAYDLALARRIQQRFLPQSPPVLAGYRIADSYAAARVIGGDYYDFFHYRDGQQGLVIADVSGKSVSGALYMARLSVQVRAMAKHLTGPVELLTGLNRKLCQEIEPGMFVTMLAAQLDVASGRLDFACAGHPAPFLRAVDGSVSELGETGALPLGAMLDTGFPQHTAVLAPGSCVLFYTDGLDEAHNDKKELFGKQRIVETLASNGGHAQATLDALLANVARFVEGEPQSDDLTLITLARESVRY